MTQFSEWLDTFIDEKALQLDQVLNVQGPSGDNHVPLQCLIDAIKNAPNTERAAIQKMIVRIDFLNGDVFDYFKHLARAIAI